MFYYLILVVNSQLMLFYIKPVPHSSSFSPEILFSNYFIFSTEVGLSEPKSDTLDFHKENETYHILDFFK